MFLIPNFFPRIKTNDTDCNERCWYLARGGVNPWAVGPGMRASQRLGQRQIDDPPLKDNARAYAHRPESPKGVQSNTMTNLQIINKIVQELATRAISKYFLFKNMSMILTFVALGRVRRPLLGQSRPICISCPHFHGFFFHSTYFGILVILD